MSYTLPKLAYPNNGLEPVIDALTVEFHYGKHHQTYLNNLNKTIEDAGYAAPDCVCELLSDLSKVPENIRTAIRNTGGGFMNHNLYWQVLGPSVAKGPEGRLAQEIDKAFGSFEAFKDAFSKAAVTRFGSGWAWLIVKEDGSVKLITTANQDSPIMKGVVPQSDYGKPIFLIDVWEHAYYLQYQNRRADYVKCFWDIVNWDAVNALYNKATGQECLLK